MCDYENGSSSTEIGAQMNKCEMICWNSQIEGFWFEYMFLQLKGIRN